MTEQINDLIEKGNAWHAQAVALLADRVAHQQAYQALSENLKGVISGENHFSASVDRNDPAPSNENGGTFNSLRDLVNAAPSGSYIDASLVGGGTHEMDGIVYLHNQFLRVRSVGATATLKPLGFVSGGFNFMSHFVMRGSEVHIDNTSVNLVLEKADEALPWNSAKKALFQSVSAGSSSFALDGCTVTGTEGASLGSCVSTQAVNARLRNVTLDGAIFGVNNISQGVAQIAQSSVTLSNGASLFSDGLPDNPNLSVN